MAEARKQTFVDRIARQRKAASVPRDMPGPPEIVALASESVAAELHRARLDLGRELHSASNDLKIRLVYLEAIEDGRFDDLPGATYAVGFVRAYADYLGLDSAEMVARFKHEVEGLDDRLQLVFPAPVPESKMPGGALLLVSGLLVMVAYGGWYTLSHKGAELADWIPQGAGGAGAPVAEATPRASQPVGEPARLMIETAGETGGDIASAAAPSMFEAPVVEAPVVEAPPGPSAGTQTPLGGEPLPQSEPGADVALPSLPGTPETVSETGDTVLALAPDGGSPSPASPDGTAQISPTPAPAPDASFEVADGPLLTAMATNGIPAAPSAESLLPDGEAREPRTYGSENEAARIVVRAVLDSWVQVRDSDDSLLLTRVLQPGDTYRVPDMPGLTLLTGNAGGIRVVVDGNALPALGPVGSVRRNVPLNPEKLLNGGAEPDPR